jgi:hypothetical protein
VEVGFIFLVSCSEAAEVFEAREASFDTIALFVEVFVVLALLFAVSFGRDNRNRAHGGHMLDDGIGVVAFIGQHMADFPLSQQGDGLGAVVDLPGGHGEVHRQTPFIGQQMNLGGQTSSGTPQSLVRAPFLRPVAACW